MTFSEQLNEYKTLIGCSAKELADASDLSISVVSRYLNGQRTPASSSLQLEKLSAGLEALALEYSVRSDSNGMALTRNQIYAVLDHILNPISGEQLSRKLNTLIDLFQINISDLANALNFDASYISRIRSGTRTPANRQDFILKLCQYIIANCNTPKQRKDIAPMLSCQPETLADQSQYLSILQNWFSSSESNADNPLSDFLHAVDDFNLDEYIKSIHFDRLKVPTIPFSLHNSRDYYGIREMTQGELDFLKATVLSPSMEPVYMFCDMPMEDMAEVDGFVKKYMFGLAMVLKKGLHIHMIHNLNRPFRELLMGLQGWIPLYMTGQVHPYYLKNYKPSVFMHLNYLSGAAALDGQCIVAHHDSGRYHLTRIKKELAYYQTRTKDLMSKASPLMDIYKSDRYPEFQDFMSLNAHVPGQRHHILSAPPIATIPDDLLERILSRHTLSDPDRQTIRQFVRQKRAQHDTILNHSTILDEIGLIRKEEFDTYPASLSLSEIFFDKDLTYTYEEYRQHLDALTDYWKSHPNYSFRLCETSAFRNIQISLMLGKFAVISKNKYPAIHFVIHHPQLRNALEHFEIVMKE